MLASLQVVCRSRKVQSYFRTRASDFSAYVPFPVCNSKRAFGPKACFGAVIMCPYQGRDVCRISRLRR
ncbi:hypothetical protein ACVIHD_007004 [Bradyrhizobium embrapense]